MRRQRDKLGTTAVQIRVGPHDQPSRAVFGQQCKSGIDFPFGAGVKNLDSLPDTTAGLGYLGQLNVKIRVIGIDEESDQRRLDHLTQKLQPLFAEVGGEHADPSGVPSRTAETRG